MTKHDAKIPVILDTDIGGDIDDTWALAMMLNSPELDVKLITTCTGDTTARAKIVARMLELAGRTDVPVGVGVAFPDPHPLPQGPWVAEYDLKRYPGKVHDDGVQAMIDTIMNSPRKVTLIAIGPAPNIAAALDRRPDIASRARLVGMFGSIRRGHEIRPDVMAEYNVRQNLAASRKTFAAPWDITITPTDTCGWIRLRDSKYRRVAQSSRPLAKAVIENYRVWLQTPGGGQESAKSRPDQSSILYDTVAIYLAYANDLLKMERLRISVRDDGFTVIDAAGREMEVAAEWKDKEAFEDLLVERIIA